MARRPLNRRWKTLGIALGSLGLIAFCIYLIGLDREIRQRFAGARWTLPAQVYASPLELYPGMELTPEALRRQLSLLGYREVRKLEGPGTYTWTKSQVDLVSRRFIFWDGAQEPQQANVRFSGGAIAGLGARELVRLDPLLIGSIYPREGEDRVLVRLDAVPPQLTAGLLAVEDHHFESHWGVDFIAILRAAVANLIAGRVVQGGSTITQQLVKNFFLNSERSLTRKFNEVLMAFLLEFHFEKAEILEAYMNEVYLGQDGERAVHGFGLASQFYFGKPLGELRMPEFALLVALVKGPSYYNPRRQPERARQRRNLVLAMFHEAGLLDEAALKRAQAEPLGVTGSAGKAAGRYPAFVDLVRRQLRGQYDEAALTGEGLRVFSTLDPAIQEALETRIREGLANLEKIKKPKKDAKTGASGAPLQAAGVVTTAEGGQVLALAGGRESNTQGFNRAVDSRRPIGSLAKPFVYLAALLQPQRYNLGTVLDDEAIEVPLPNGETWEPHNYDGESHGPVPLYRALAQSYNYATVRLGLEVGAPAVAQVFAAAGHPGGAPPALQSMFLGSLDLSPLDMAQMYSTFASGGYYTPLLAIREVLRADGRPLTRYEFNVRRTLPEGPLYLLNWALEQVVQTGTAASTAVWVPRSTRLAGKTGTTDELRDSWFAGYGADRVAVVWVGRDDNTPAGFTGASGALTIWAPLMADIHAQGLQPRLPNDVEEIAIDPVTGLRADFTCRETVLIPYLKDHPLEDYAPCAIGRAPLRWLQDRF